MPRQRPRLGARRSTVPTLGDGAALPAPVLGWRSGPTSLRVSLGTLGQRGDGFLLSERERVVQAIT